LVRNILYTNLLGVHVGRFPIADEELAKIWICKRCKARNRAGATKCRKCGYRYLRPKKKELAPKK